MGVSLLDPVHPGEEDAAAANVALAQVAEYLNRHPDGPAQVRLRVEDDSEELVVPRGVVELVARILAHMASGQGVSVVPTRAELTTQQAADLLNVSRPHLIGLLEAGEIDYRKVGKHRRIKVSSLLAYMRADDHRRRGAADELSTLTQEMGLT
jgi:excisionase family DNA binding protein